MPEIITDRDLKKAFSILKPDVIKTIAYRESDKSYIGCELNLT